MAISEQEEREIEREMSDQLANLTQRARETEERAATARKRARAELQHDLSEARASAQAQAERFRERAQANRGELATWWADVREGWNERVAATREDIEAKRAEHDVDRAEHRADHAETDALYWIDFACTAVEEAEYAVLYAVHARMEADDVAAKHAAA